MKQNKKQSLLFYILAFAVPALLYMALLAFEGIMPFGSEHSIAYIDADGQYISYFAYYKQMLAGEQSFIYTFSKLIGGDMVGLGAYYLLSPFNLILLLFPVAKMAQAMAVMAVAKIGAAGLTAAVFFEHHLGRNAKSIFLSTAFALMSYNIIYMQNIMWIDGVIMLPLIALGIDRILEGKSSLLYIIALFYGIFVNYYIGFMLCGASVLYCFYRLISCGNSFTRKTSSFARYAVSSFFAGAMNAVIILPVFASLQGTSKSSLPLNQLIGLQTQLSFTDLIKHILLPQPTLRDMSAMLPNVFAGFAVTLLCAAFLILPKISWRKKIGACLVAVVFLLSFYFKTLYCFWHGFAAPVCFEYRFAFIFTFFMLIWAGEFLYNININKFITVTLIAVNCGTLFWYGHQNYAETNLPSNRFEEFVNTNLPIVEEIKALEEENGSFYRIEKDYLYNNNDAMTLGYSGMTHYSSGEKLVTRKAVKAAGYSFSEAYGNYNNGSTLANDSLFGIKYLLNKSVHRYGLEAIAQYGDTTVYKNPYSWPLAIKADAAVADINIDDIPQGKLAEELLCAAWGYRTNFTPDILWTSDKEYEHTVTTYTDEEGKYYIAPAEGEEYGYLVCSFEMPETSNLYINIISDSRGSVKDITWGDNKIKNYPGYYNVGLKYMGSYEKGKEITVTLKIEKPLHVESLEFIYDNFGGLYSLNSVAADMETNGYRDTGFDGDSFTVSGTMDETEGMLLMIPYNEGWKIKVNGESADFRCVADNFVYVDVPSGDFVVDVKFVPPGLIAGGTVSFAVLLTATAYLITEKKKFL